MTLPIKLYISLALKPANCVVFSCHTYGYAAFIRLVSGFQLVVKCTVNWEVTY